jgi:class 3 adenylate cyclase
VRAADGRSGTALTTHPALGQAISALSRSGYWAIALDTQWRVVAETAEQAAATSAGTAINGAFFYGPDGLAWEGGVEIIRETIRHVGSWMLTDLAVDRSGLGEMLHPLLSDSLAEIQPCDELTALSWDPLTEYQGEGIGLTQVAQRIRDSNGLVVGTVILTKPHVGMNTISMLTSSADLPHLQRMHGLGAATRRPAAVLFADLEGSAQLSKRMPTASYFALVRRITRAADMCVIAEGGLVGRHAGDGVAAFFVAETAESESATARSCIVAARAVQAAMRRIAERHDLPAADVTVRAGLHWGSNLHIGAIITPGRAEVTALGDEVNEAARIEACASGGRILASKDVIERLDTDDIAALALDPSRIAYTQLAELSTATDKARRDAPAIPVYDISTGTS